MKPYIIKLDKLIVTGKVGAWCQIPYPKHPKGCPNYGNKMKCPPLSPWVEALFNLSKPLYFVHSEFDLESHIERMRQKHPSWSELQCRCVLYWQGTSRKQLKERVDEAKWSLGTNITTFCPEGMGVNVYATARKNGLNLERIRHIKTCRHVALIGSN